MVKELLIAAGVAILAAVVIDPKISGAIATVLIVGAAISCELWKR